LSDVYLRLLKETHKGNLVIEGYYVWCPIRVGDFAKRRHMGKDGRRLDKIIQYVYAQRRLFDKNFSIHDAINWSEILLDFDENEWLRGNLENYVKKKYEKYLEEWPNDSTGGLSFAEVMALNVFHDDRDLENLIKSLIGYGVLSTQSDWDSNYIYFRSVKTSELGLENLKKYVVKKSDYKWFFWMDVGAWSSNSAVVGIVTPHEVAMYDIYSSKNCSRPASGTLAAQILNSLGEVLPGGTVFYQNLKNIKPIKTPVTNDEVIFVIPDLHLHLFKGFTADNFKQPGSGEKPLDEILATVLSVIDKYTSKVSLRIVQVGDFYELWESAMLLCIGLNPDWDFVELTYLTAHSLWSQLPLALKLAIKPPNKKEMIKYINAMKAEAKRRKLDEVFSKPELDKLRLPWTVGKGENVKTNAQLKDVWKEIQKETEKLHQALFKKATKGKFNIDCNQTIIAGNHDSFLGHVFAHEDGINKVIRFEHLHYNDPYNKPSNMKAGQFMTILNLIAETLGFGDKVKALETSRRPDFLRDVATINWERCKKGKPMYDLIITGHTHRAYAQVVRMKLSQSALTIEPTTGNVRYDQGWPKATSKYQKAEILMLARKNLNAILGGMAAMGWRGFPTALCLWVFGVDPSKPFQIK